ncbi:hypothetical protein KVF89_10705 [Nocardioides carbamazepini]|uniref:hypothetical protein n=1 Tax=Nocardioides carbamazepini TaxID=2854259 RepID=UPI00214A2CCC|nr:hypothetical protein [Nocardioides carbamazepini]MCR1783005.1 hypothetical protein [Nocardioides carbamazepini]
MSKMDAVRAMREARYAEAQARAGRPAPAAKRAKPASAAPVAPAAAPTQDDGAADDTDGLCGHRNMSGRTCTRERGHAAKSHRYS